MRRHYKLIGHDLDLWPLMSDLSAHSHGENVCDKLHWNLPTKYRAVASREVGVIWWTADGRLDGRPVNMMHPPSVVGGGIKTCINITGNTALYTPRIRVNSQVVRITRIGQTADAWDCVTLQQAFSDIWVQCKRCEMSLQLSEWSVLDATVTECVRRWRRRLSLSCVQQVWQRWLQQYASCAK